MARRVSSSVLPGRTFGQTGSSGLRVSAITAQRRAMASVLSQASGRSANRARIAAAGLNQCSGVTRRRSRSDSRRASAMQSRASCASCMSGLAKKQSLVATSGMPRGVGQRDQAGLDGLFHGQAMAVQFHHRAVGEGLGEAGEQTLGLGLLALRQQAGERAVRAAGEQDQAGGVLADARERNLRLQAGLGFQEAGGGQALEVGEALRRLGEQHDRVGGEARIVLAGDARSGSR